MISFAATVEIPNMSRREETAWRIVGVVAVVAGLMLALAIICVGERRVTPFVVCYTHPPSEEMLN